MADLAPFLSRARSAQNDFEARRAATQRELDKMSSRANEQRLALWGALADWSAEKEAETENPLYAIPGTIGTALSDEESVALLGVALSLRGGKGAGSGPVYKTNGEAAKAAKDLGYQKTNELSNGQSVFKSGKLYITRDVDGHNGGAWKMARSVAELGSKSTRLGTFDANLKKIGE